jgi:hypothetical protein
MHIRALKKEDILQLHERGVQYDMREHIDEAKLHLLEDEISYSFLNDSNLVLVCFGMARLWSGRGTVWAIFSEEGKQKIRRILPIIRNLLKNSPMHRLETPIPCGNTKLERWMKAVGFTLEVPCARKYYPDGSDASLYVLVKD